jgi:hypothetical protein
MGLVFGVHSGIDVAAVPAVVCFLVPCKTLALPEPMVHKLSLLAGALVSLEVLTLGNGLL